jgi:peptide/nickel transport system substrate-binding protein
MKASLWKQLAACAILAVVVLILAGCTQEPAPTEMPAEPVATEEPQVQPTEAPQVEPTAMPTEEPVASEPVTMRVGTTYIWDTANPTYGWYNYGLRYLVYDTLVEEAGIGRFVPGLAESWTYSDDGLVWTFKIREGVTFHDGTPCTADEVAWSLNWTIENEIETFSFYLVNFQEIVALDPTTLQVTLSEPVGNMEYLLMYVWILPPSVWEGMTYDDIMEFEDLSAAMGTGPYKLVEWVEGEYLILEANENYWRGKPAIDRMVWQEFATEDAAVQALIAGEIDVIAADTIPTTAIGTLEDAENIQVPIMESTSIDELIISQRA